MSFFDMDYDVSVLIEEIKKRPLLYEQSFSSNNDDLKQKLWEEVYTRVLPQWNQLNPAQRFWKADELQDRWRRLRKKFQKMHKRSIRKKPFKYLDQLTFLLPIKENQKLTNNSMNNNNLLTECQREPPQTHLNTLADTNCIPDFSSASYTPGVGYILDNFSLSTIGSTKSNSIDQSESSSDIHINDNNNELNGNVKEQTNSEEEEEDNNSLNNSEIDKDPDKDEEFLLSLLPAFEEFDNLTKLEVKSDILRIVTKRLKQNIAMQNNEST